VGEIDVVDPAMQLVVGAAVAGAEGAGEQAENAGLVEGGEALDLVAVAGADQPRV